MRLHFDSNWLRQKLAEMDAAGIEEPSGLIACSPEIYAEMMKMTTQVKIEITQEHVPVIVETLRSDESVQHRQTLTAVGAIAVEYVHSGQTLRVREMTTDEQHNARAAE